MDIVSMDDSRPAEECIRFLKDLSRLLVAKATREHTLSPQLSEVMTLIEAEDWARACKYEFAYEDLTPAQAEMLRQVIGLFQKAEWLTIPGVDKTQAGLAKWLEAEERCRITNELFSQHDAGACSFSAPVEAVYYRAQRKIARVLGNVPKLSDLKFKFGSGANRSVKKKDASTSRKLGAHITCSEDLWPHREVIMAEMPAWRDSMLDHTNGLKVPFTCKGGILNFVPKDAFYYRIVEPPPSLNNLVQMAIGSYMVKRMKPFGLQISDQTVNQRYAEIGSRTGEYATIDLVSASDMMATGLMRSLLPFDWFVFLNSSRSEMTFDGKKDIRQEKFVGMGNGFTFPLETLVFWALASSVKDEGWASVYGDDIVVKTEDYSAVCDILDHAGFVPNRKKSFASGSFRESCGKDYHRGFQIRPIYQKELIDGFELFRLHNFFVRKGWEDVAKWIRREIPQHFVIYGPDGYGDGHLLGPWKGFRKESHIRSGYGGVLFDTFTRKGRRDERFHRSGDRVLPQYSIYIRENGERVEVERLGGIPRFVKQPFIQYSSEPLGEIRKTGVKSLTLPGNAGYKRISIYTFASPTR